MAEPSYAIHIAHRDDDWAERVVGPFNTPDEAIRALENSPRWELDDRPEFSKIWHHVDDWPYLAVVVKIEDEL